MSREIGLMAGEIWRTLREKGEMSVAALKKAVGARDATADWAIGWLAREDKVVLRKERSTFKIALHGGAQNKEAIEIHQQLATDPNYRAFIAEAAKLEAKYPGYMVAYADGARVAMGRSPQDLLENLPPEYRTRVLFIKDLPDRTVRFHRPFLIHEN